MTYTLPIYTRQKALELFVAGLISRIEFDAMIRWHMCAGARVK